MVIIEEQISRKKNSPIQIHKFNHLSSQARKRNGALEYIDHMCHNTPGDNTSEKYVIKIPRFDSGTPEEWIIFVDLVQKSLV